MLSRVELPIVVGVLVHLLPVSLNALGQDSHASTTQPDPPAWAVGQEWRLLVRHYGPRPERATADPFAIQESLLPRPRAFHVKARVLDLTERAGRRCVRIGFTLEADATSLYSGDPPRGEAAQGDEYTLTLDVQTSKAVDLQDRLTGSSHQPAGAGDCTALLTRWSRFPVDWVISRADLQNPAECSDLMNFTDFRPTPERPSPSSAVRRSVSPRPDGTLRIAVGRVSLIPHRETGRPPQEADHEIEQVWHPSELWWRSFQRFNHGRIDMEAVLESDPAGSGAPWVLPTSRPTSASAASAGPTWRVGEEWRLLIKDLRFKSAHYTRAWVTELTEIDGRPYVRIGFLAEPGALRKDRKAGYVLTIDARTWEVVQLDHPKWFGGATDRPLDAEGYKLLLPILGLPLDWIVQRADLSDIGARQETLHMPGRSSAPFVRRTISTPEPDGTVRISVGVWVPTVCDQAGEWQPPTDAMFEVEQVWHPGEFWWRSYRRWKVGQLELEATRVFD